MVCDQPPDMGGTDQGMTPPEYLLTSLATCAAYYAVQYLKTRNLPVDGVQVKVSGEKLREPARVGNFRIEVTAPGLDPHHEAGMLRTVRSCLIHATLVCEPDIETVLHTGVEARV